MKIMRIVVDYDEIPIATVLVQGPEEESRALDVLHPLADKYGIEWIIEDINSLDQAVELIEEALGD